MTRQKPELLPVKSIWWPTTPDGTQERLTANDKMTLRFLDEYLGDRNERWVLQIENGVEIARHNARFLESIVWEEPASTTETGAPQ